MRRGGPARARHGDLALSVSRHVLELQDAIMSILGYGQLIQDVGAFPSERYGQMSTGSPLLPVDDDTPSIGWLWVGVVDGLSSC